MLETRVGKWATVPGTPWESRYPGPARIRRSPGPEAVASPGAPRDDNLPSIVLIFHSSPASMKSSHGLGSMASAHCQTCFAAVCSAAQTSAHDGMRSSCRHTDVAVSVPKPLTHRALFSDKRRRVRMKRCHQAGAPWLNAQVHRPRTSASVPCKTNNGLLAFSTTGYPIPHRYDCLHGSTEDNGGPCFCLAASHRAAHARRPRNVARDPNVSVGPPPSSLQDYGTLSPSFVLDSPIPDLRPSDIHASVGNSAPPLDNGAGTA